MKIKLYKSVALCSLLALAGCHDFEELNTNPYAPIYDPTVENVSADGIDIDYTLTEHAMASCFGDSESHCPNEKSCGYKNPCTKFKESPIKVEDIEERGDKDECKG
jgi:hypothetical protein